MFEMIRLVRTEFTFSEEVIQSLQKKYPIDTPVTAIAKLEFSEGRRKETHEPNGAQIKLTVSVQPVHTDKADPMKAIPIVHGLMEYHFTLSDKNKVEDEAAFDSVWILARIHIQKVFVEFGFPSPPIPLQRVKTNGHQKNHDTPATRNEIDNP